MSQDFRKVYRVGTVKVHAARGRIAADVFIRAELKKGRLSLVGVVGPRASGNSWGGAGQIVGSLEADEISPAPGWTSETIRELLTLWERWHLNDMRRECAHQRAAGWVEKASRKVKLYRYRLTSEASKEQRAAKEAAETALVEGRSFTPTAQQQRAAARPYEIVSPHEGLAVDEMPYYEPARPLWPGHSTQPVEEKALGWLKPEEHPEGLLCRPCPTCGYKYGSEWRREDVPADVLNRLRELPESDSHCPWRNL